MSRLVDRLLGLAVGATLGMMLWLFLVALASFFPESNAALWVGMSKGIWLGMCIWGWYGGAYALGRIVAWVRQR